MATQGPLYPGTVTTLSTGTESANDWLTPGNISADDGSEAQITAATYDSPDVSFQLIAANFGFTLGSGDTVNGVTVEIDRRSIIASSGVDFRVQLRDASGTLVGTNKASATVWPTTSTVATYGGAADTWTASPTPAMVNDVDFGVVLSAQANIANADIGVDFIRVTITYTPGAQTVTAPLIDQSGATFAPVVDLAGAGTIITQNTAEGGSHGTAVTTGNSGGGSGDAFAEVSIGTAGAVTFDNTHPAHGSLAYKWVTANSTDVCYFRFADLGTASSTEFTRFYMYFDALPSNVATTSSIFHLFRSATTNRGGLRLAGDPSTTAGVIRLIDSAGVAQGTTGVTLSVSTLYRIETQIVGNATTGSLECRIYLGDSTTVTSTLTATNINTGGTIDRSTLGSRVAGNVSSWTVYFDDWAIATDDWIGPAAASAQTVSPSLIDQSGVTFAPTLLNPQTVTASLISQVGATFAPQVNQQVQAAFIDRSGATFAPTVNLAAGAQSVSPGLISSVGTTFAPTVNQQVQAAFISQVGATFTPTVIPAQVVSVGLIDQSGQTFAPMLSLGGQIVSVPLIGAYGGYEQGYATGGYAIFPPDVSIPAAPVVFAPLIAQTGATFAITITDLWAFQTDAFQNDAFQLEAAGGTNIPITAGAATLAGQPVGISTDIPITNGAVSQTGQTVSLAFGTNIPITQGALTHTGQSVLIVRSVPVTNGAVTQSGQSVGITTSIPLSNGALTQTGQSVVFTKNLALTQGALTQSGQLLTVSIGTTIPITPGALSHTGQSTSITTNVPITAGALTLSRPTITVSIGTTIAITAGQVSVSGRSVVMTNGFVIGAGAMSLAGGSVTVATGLDVSITPGALSWTGQDGTLVYTIPISAGASSISGQTVGVVLSGAGIGEPVSHPSAILISVQGMVERVPI